MLSVAILGIAVLFGGLLTTREGFSYSVTDNIIAKEKALANKALPKDAICFDNLKCSTGRCSSQEQEGGKKVLGTCY